MAFIGIKFDMSQAHAKALAVGASADQIPYALARSLNDAAEQTRSYLIANTWPGHVTQRNTAFISAALTTKGARATKGDLSVEIYDRLGRANLALHARGGTRVAKGSFIAVGSANVSRGAHGVPAAQRPRALKNSFRRGNNVYQRTGKGRNARVRLMYVLKPTARIPRDVPFVEDFRSLMEQWLEYYIPVNVAVAMRTARR